MKLYVSEKDFDTYNEKIVTFNDVDLAIYDKKYDAYDIVETIERGAAIKSLEQHDKELLQEFANNLMNVLSDEMFFEKEMEDIEIYVSQLLKERGAKINKDQRISELEKENAELYDLIKSDMVEKVEE